LPLAHVLPQAPQFVALFASVVHAPLQHAWVAPQTLPQPPQLFGSSFMSVHW
jgi:hypothetical protein